MNLRLIETDSALVDLEAIVDRLTGEAGPITARRFIEATRETYELLATMPGMGTARNYRRSELTGMRMFPLARFPKYLIFYWATETELNIMRVLHGAQDISAIFSPPDEGQGDPSE